MNKSLLIAFFALLCFPAFAGYELDSLKTSLDKAKGADKIDILNRLSALNHDKDPKEALFYAREAIKYASSSGDKARLAEAYINAGIVLRNTGQSDKALSYFFNASRITDELNLPHTKADALHKISVTYLLVRDFDNALKYGQEEVAIWKSINEEMGLSKALNSMGLTYLNIERYEEAASALHDALVLAEKYHDQDLIYKPLINLGDLYIKQGRPQDAVPYLEKAHRISEQLSNKFGMTSSLLKLGEAYFAQKEYKKAIAAVKDAQKAAEELHSIALLRNTYKTLGDIYEASEEYKPALEFNRLYISTEDSMVGEITKRRIAQMEAKYEIAHMEQELERMTREANYNNVRLIFIISIVALAGILAVVIINRKQLKTQTTGELSVRDSVLKERTQEITLQQEVINKKNAQITETSEYALRVQEAVVHTMPTFLNIFSDCFLINVPKEVASGDFCWFAHQNDSIIVAVGDCTGYGMQGAFNTIVAHNLLTQIAAETQYRTPADILRELDRKLSKLMHSQQSQGYEERMKIGVCSININNKRVTYAGANIPLYIVTEGQLKTVPADNQWLDGKLHRQTDAFNNQMLNLKKGDKLLLLTNGFCSQIGGENAEELGNARLEGILAAQSNMGLSQIKEHLSIALEDWKGLKPQNDDMLAFGLQL